MLQRPLMRPGRRTGVLLLLGMLAGAVGACSGSEAARKPPDERFGHRFENTAPGERETITIAPPDTAQAYFYYPAVYDTLHIRPGPFSPDASAATQAVPVEVLVKGALPNTCAELGDVEQERVGHLVFVALQMRKPRGAVCAAVKRPYRFYLTLPGTYRPGAYTLTLNDEPHPFVVSAPGDEEAGYLGIAPASVNLRR